ncbi:hypothetical protein GGI17_001976 [Coemansia sp. S146]|nr:hypothetical protein GGI17_001976 [Coemansia sp. S146]
MRVSLAIAFTVAVVFVAARPVDVHVKGFALHEQTALLRRDEGPTSGKQNNNDTHTSQASPPANDSRPPPNSQPGASSNSDHPPAKAPEPGRGSGDNRVDPPQHMRDESSPQPQHNPDDDHSGAREQPQPQAQPQSQPKDERNDAHDGGNGNSNSNGNNNGQNSSNSSSNNANANSNNSNGHQEESRPKGDNQGPRPDNNSRPVHEHFEQVQNPGGNPGNIDRLTHDVVNDDRNGVHTNIVQRVSVSGNNVSGQVTDRVVQGGNGVFVNGRGNTIVPPSFMNPSGPNGPSRGNRQ